VAVPFWQDLKNEFGNAPLTVILALVAIVFATIQFFDSLHLKRRIGSVISKEDEVLTRIETVTGQIEGVGQSLSSRFVGTFPRNMKQISEVVGCAGRFSLILTDWVGYAMYSAHPAYEEYKQQLRRINENRVPVYILAYSRKCLEEQFRDQFRKEEFDAEKTGNRFINFFERYRHGKPAPLNYDEFLAEMLTIEQEQRRELELLGMNLQELSERSLVLMWMEDGEEAVFCFQTHGGNERGLSFRTREIGLITSLRDLFSARWRGVLPSLPHEHTVAGPDKAADPR
jgi:hypothetical protein